MRQKTPQKIIRHHFINEVKQSVIKIFNSEIDLASNKINFLSHSFAANRNTSNNK